MPTNPPSPQSEHPSPEATTAKPRHHQGGFRDALTHPGVPSFTSAGALARLPVAMVALAIVLLVSETTGSYAYAGVMSAAFAVTAALASIVTSRWADRSGQRVVLRVLAPGHGALLALFTLSVVEGSPRALQIGLVVAAGATSPAIGSYVRARWSFLAERNEAPHLLRLGFAWESILDELIFTLGPLLTTALAFNVGFPSPLIAAALAVVIGSVWLSMSTSTTPPTRPRDTEHASLFAVARTRGLLILIGAALGLGLLFGALDVGAVAFTRDRGSGATAGVVLAAFAAASMVGGIAYGIRRWPGALHRHTQMAALALAIVSAGLWFVDSNAGLIVVAAGAGLMVAPTLIGIFSLTQRVVKPANLTEGLTWTNSGLAAGFAFGSGLSGVLVDNFGARAGLGLCVAGALASAVMLLAGSRSINTPAPEEAGDVPSVVPAAWNDDPLPGPHPGA